MAASWCPRCGSDLVSPGPYDSAWRCSEHGPTSPLTALSTVDLDGLEHIKSRADVPLWLFDPAPVNWELCGLASVGDPRGKVTATVSAYRGPAPLGGDGEWLVIAEEPGIGLGAAYAQSRATADSAQLGSSTPARVQAAGRPTPLWMASDAAAHLSAYVGEAHGVWIWMVCFPADAGYALLDDLNLVDARSQSSSPLGAGPVSKRLRPLH